jgi:hypothetical protein
MTISTTTGESFRIVPDKWKDINDNDIARMFDSFTNFVLQNEEMMTFDEAEKAQNIMSEWKNHLKTRNIDTGKYHWF